MKRLLGLVPLITTLAVAEPVVEVPIELRGEQVSISRELLEAIIQENILQKKVNALLNQRQIELNDRMSQLVNAGLMCL